MTLSDVFSFPNPVNEVSARLVAGGAAVGAWITVGTCLLYTSRCV